VFIEDSIYSSSLLPVVTSSREILQSGRDLIINREEILSSSNYLLRHQHNEAVQRFFYTALLFIVALSRYYSLILTEHRRSRIYLSHIMNNQSNSFIWKEKSERSNRLTTKRIKDSALSAVFQLPAPSRARGAQTVE